MDITALPHQPPPLSHAVVVVVLLLVGAKLAGEPGFAACTQTLAAHQMSPKTSNNEKPCRFTPNTQHQTGVHA